MDEVVLRAMTRWPDVPAVFGWLSLDRRGRWRLRGETIGNGTACDFISRNYLADVHGRWFFQNGPQRVFVSLAAAPMVFGLQPDGRLRAHTGVFVDMPRRVLLDEHGDLLFETPLGAGALDVGDLSLLVERFCDADGAPLADEVVETALADADGAVALWLRLAGPPLAVERIASKQAPAMLGFVREPAACSEDDAEVCG